MPEMILSLGLLVVAALLVGVGIQIGRSFSRQDTGRTTRQSDFAATARTLQRLVEEGRIDAQLQKQLLELLREASDEQAAVPPLRLPPIPIPSATSESVPAETASSSAAGGTAAAPSPLPVDGEDFVEAEIVDEAPPPILHPHDAPQQLVAPERSRIADLHPLDRPEPIAVPLPSRPQQRRRALADVLQAFMQDKNIRWGELISGLLIVGCSVALVISLRHEIESLSERFVYLPALLFMLATAAIHGAGNYTLRRWNLQATSRGVLIIATLLIPINFLAAIIVTGSPTRQLPADHPLYILSVAVGLLVFGTMAYFAGQALLRKGVWRFWLGVMGPSVGQLVINRLATGGVTAAAAIALVSLPLITYLVATIGQLRSATRRARIGVALARDTLLVFGVATFALAAAVALLLSKSDSVSTALAWLSTPLSLPAVVTLATGLALHRRVQSRQGTTLKNVGTSLALLGGVLMLVAVLLAWPAPQLLVMVGLFGFVSLTVLAGVGRLAVLHVPALACGSLACLVGFHLQQGSFSGYEANLSERMFDLLFLGRSSLVLTVFACGAGGIAAVLFQRGHRASALSYGIGSGGIAGTSLLLAIAVGFLGTAAREADLASPILLFYALLLLAASHRVPTAMISWGGSALLLVSLIHSCGWNSTVQDWLAGASLLPARPVLVATIGHGLIAALMAALLVRRGQFAALNSPGRDRFIYRLVRSALVSSLMALPWSLDVSGQPFSHHAWYMAGLALVWLAATSVERSAVYFGMFQTLATVAIAFTVAAVCQQQRWWNNDWLAPQHLYAQFGTLSVWCLAWSVGRRCSRGRWPEANRLMRGGRQTVDEVVLAAVVVGMFLLCVWGCCPGIALELGIADAGVADEPPTWQAIFAGRAWIALLLLTMATAGSLIERFSMQTFSALFIVAATAALLAGGRLDGTLAVASGLRWSFALLGIALTIAVCFGGRILDFLHSAGWLYDAPTDGQLGKAARRWTLGFTAIPVLGLTTANLVLAAAGEAPDGPIADSFFSRIGSELSFGIPLTLLTAALIIHAMRERKPRLMLAGSAVFQYLVNLAYFLPILQNPGLRSDWSVAIGCLQCNSLGLALFALAWLAVRRWVEPPFDVSHERLPDHCLPDRGLMVDRCLMVQCSGALLATVLTAGLATGLVVASPDDLTRFAELGDWPSFLVCLLGFGAAAWLLHPHLDRFAVSLLIGFLLSLGGPLAISLEGNAGDWRSLHTLMVVWPALAMLATALAWLDPRRSGRLEHAGLEEARFAGRQVWPRGSAVWWAGLLVGMSTLLALRSAPDDPDGPWWAFGTTLAAACIAGSLGFRTRRQVFAYASTLLAALAATIVWWGVWPTGRVQGVLELVQLNLLSIVAASLVWLAAEVRSQRERGSSFDSVTKLSPVHWAVAIIATSLSLLIVLFGGALTGPFELPRSDLDIANRLGWLLLPLLGGLLVGTLWDGRMRLTLPLLYAWGAVAVLMSLDEVDQRLAFDGQTVFVFAGLLLAAYVAASGHAWKYGVHLAALGNRLGIPNTVQQLKLTRNWLPTVTLLVSAVIATIEFAVVLAFPERWMRVSAAFAPLLLAYGVGCQAQRERRTLMQYMGLFLVSLSAVYAAWADIQPGWRETLVLERVVRLLMVLAALALLYAVPLSRWTRHRGSDWLPNVRRMAVHCSLSAVTVLLAVLLLELAYFVPGVGVPFGNAYEVAAVAAVLVGLIVALLALALSPQRDPVALSEQGRMGCVYAAQVVGALLFAHLYLSAPRLFGSLQAYWPYIVMVIAFAGVGAGELFQRSGLRVLAEPLQRTGGFLPLLPALGWWLNRSLGIDAAGHYSLLLFLAGLLYVVLSMLRRSATSALGAALAGNASLWALLADYQALSLLKHPQFWLIPPAITTLLAAQINRRRLDENQLTGIRYLCLLVIYVSSTADIFIEGVGASLWEPMVLATISVLGVFVGIGLQIRAFLYLGTTFVLLSVVSMVWHAYTRIQHVGIWWGFGIVLGLLILTIFGLFEKQRPELTRIIENMRRWEH